MLSSVAARSATVLATGAGVSWKWTSGERPARLISPVVTRRPNRLLYAAGIRIDPPVSSPIPTSPRFAATPAAVPALEPPDSRSGAYGFLVWSVSDEDENQPAAKSHMAVLARMTAPASFNFATTVASFSGTYPVSRIEPNVVRSPAVSAWSLTRTGTPCSGPQSLP